MNFAPFGNLMASMYTDKMDIFRYTQKEEEDGSTSSVLSQTATQKEVPCRISFVTNDNSEPTADDINHLSIQIKIFCTATQDVVKGDKLVVTRLAYNGEVLATYVGKASKPRQYTTHKEIILEEVGEA